MLMANLLRNDAWLPEAVMQAAQMLPPALLGWHRDHMKTTAVPSRTLISKYRLAFDAGFSLLWQDLVAERTEIWFRF